MPLEEGEFVSEKELVTELKGANKIKGNDYVGISKYTETPDGQERYRKSVFLAWDAREKLIELLKKIGE